MSGFGNDGEGIKGFKALSGDLAPEVRELALAMRRLLKATERSLRDFSVSHHRGPGSVSRYLSGERVPDKEFLDVLMKSACNALGQEVTADMQAHLYRLHREALLAVQPARYREQMASDRLEDAILQKEQAELLIRDLQAEVSDQQRQLGDLDAQVQQVETACTQERQRHGAELELHRRQRQTLRERCEQLRRDIEDLEAALEEAVRERDAARHRCAELEEELATAQDQVVREGLEREAAEERLRVAKAANAAEQRVVDLERIQQEAEQVRREAARDAAAQREEAEATAKRIIEEATTTVTRIRPSMVPRSAALRRLRDAAVAISEQRLPALIDQLSHYDPSHVDTRVAPIPINTRDEIGDVARALDQVHREAVRLAAEQALLRGGINALFATLSRRTQSLIADQLALLTDLENSEKDAGRLADLHRLDHAATRVRRNTETLLILAGEKPGRRWDQPVALAEVLRAACSEVKDYQRIRLTGIPEAVVHGRAVTDLVHLLAELLENATVFSPPQTEVRVSATRLPDGRMLIEIHDRGISFTAEGYDIVNQKLAAPPAIMDPSMSTRLGLFVVSRLADRHGIRVQLRPTDGLGGTIALVMLPNATVPQPGTRVPQDGPALPEIVPVQQPLPQQDWDIT